MATICSNDIEIGSPFIQLSSEDTFYDINDILQRLIQLETQRQVEFVELSCKNCGGKIQQKYHDSIFKCPYCKTVYAVGYKQVNAT